MQEITWLFVIPKNCFQSFEPHVWMVKVRTLKKNALNKRLELNSNWSLQFNDEDPAVWSIELLAHELTCKNGWVSHTYPRFSIWTWHRMWWRHIFLILSTIHLVGFHAVSLNSLSFANYVNRRLLKMTFLQDTT